MLEDELMKGKLARIDLQLVASVLWNLFLIAVGSVLCALAVNGILIPKEFLSAGFMGLALLIYYLIPSLPVAYLYFLLNVPLYALGWRYVGRRFFLYSIAGMLIFTLAVRFVQFSVNVEDKLLCALLAGIIGGGGAGIILRSLGSAGGLDILSVILMQRFSVRLGTTSLGFNGIMLAGAALIFSLDRVLYTLIYIFVTSYMVNLVVTGLSQRKAALIISHEWKRISEIIMKDINRGVTLMEGEGGFSGQKTKILYTVITFRELARLKSLIRGVDPDAFVVVTDTLEVMGKGIGNQPHW